MKFKSFVQIEYLIEETKFRLVDRFNRNTLSREDGQENNTIITRSLTEHVNLRMSYVSICVELRLH